MFCAVHQLGVVVLSIHTRRGKTHPECCKKLCTVCPQPCLVMLWTSSRGTGMIPVSTLVTRVPFIYHVVCFPWLLTQNIMEAPSTGCRVLLGGMITAPINGQAYALIEDLRLRYGMCPRQVSASHLTAEIAPLANGAA